MKQHTPDALAAIQTLLRRYPDDFRATEQRCRYPYGTMLAADDLARLFRRRAELRPTSYVASFKAASQLFLYAGSHAAQPFVDGARQLMPPDARAYEVAWLDSAALFGKWADGDVTAVAARLHVGQGAGGVRPRPAGSRGP